MTRRTIGLFIIFTLSLLGVALALEAQPAGKVARIGYLAPGTATISAGTQAFIDGLRDHGWIEGQNLAIEYRWAEWRGRAAPRPCGRTGAVATGRHICREHARGPGHEADGHHPPRRLRRGE